LERPYDKPVFDVLCAKKDKTYYTGFMRDDKEIEAKMRIYVDGIKTAVENKSL